MPATSPSREAGDAASRKRVLEGSSEESGDEAATTGGGGGQDQKKARNSISVMGRALLNPTLEVLPQHHALCSVLHGFRRCLALPHSRMAPLLHSPARARLRTDPTLLQHSPSQPTRLWFRD